MRTFVVLLLAALSAPGVALARPTGAKPPKTETRTGYLSYQSRCQSFGITFSEKPDPDPVRPQGRQCVVFPALESLAMPDDAKREAFRALTGMHVKVTFTTPDPYTIELVSVEQVK
jgi:hypothetical protein